MLGPLGDEDGVFGSETLFLMYFLFHLVLDLFVHVFLSTSFRLLAKSPRNGEFFRSWLLRWCPVVDRHAAIESLQVAVRKGMHQVGFPQSIFSSVKTSKVLDKLWQNHTLVGRG